MKHLKKTAALLAAVMLMSSCGEETTTKETKADGSAAENPAQTTTTEKAADNNDPFGGIFGDNQGDATTTGNGGDAWQNTETTTAPATEETTTTTTAPALVSGDGLIVRERYSEFNQLNNGYALLSESNTYYVTNMKGEISLEMKRPDDAYYRYKLLKSGKILNFNDYREFRNDIYAYGSEITMYGANGDVVMSPEKSGFDKVIISNDDYFLVMKNDTGFSGDTHYLGTINMNGEWTKELTAVTEEFNYENINYWARVNGTNGNNYVVAPLAKDGIALIDITKCEVVFKTDEKYNNDKNFRFRAPSDFGWNLDGNTLYAIDYGKYNIETGAFTSWKEFAGLDKTVFEDNDRKYKTEAWYYDNFYYGYYSLYDRKDHSTAYDYYLFDKEMSKSVPLNDYKVYDKSYIGYKGGNAILAAKGKDSGVYLCVVNSEGKYVFEPIRLGKEDDGVRFTYFRIFDNYVVYVIRGENTINAVDMAGNVVSQAFEGEFKAYDNVNGVYAVEMNNNDVCFFGVDGSQKLQITRAER